MAETQKFERKHFFINRELQGKYMLTFLIPMVVMLAFMLLTLYFASETVVSTTTSTIKEDIRVKVASRLQDRQESVQIYRAVLDDIQGYLRDFSSNERYRRVVINSLVIVFGVGLLLVIIQIVLLTIFFSHKIAGPVYRFERACHDVIGGDYTQSVTLRRGDEMKNLASLLNEVIGASRQRLIDLSEAQTEEERRKILQTIRL
jgi:nitrate/nitrite-specific signal transduction histidine kinase